MSFYLFSCKSYSMSFYISSCMYIVHFLSYVLHIYTSSMSSHMSSLSLSCPPACSSAILSAVDSSTGSSESECSASCSATCQLVFCLFTDISKTNDNFMKAYNKYCRYGGRRFESGGTEQPTLWISAKPSNCFIFKKPSQNKSFLQRIMSFFVNFNNN